MLYPKPHSRLIEEWNALTQAIADISIADHCVLRGVAPASLEVLAASKSPGSTLSPGERVQRQGDNYCEAAIDSKKPVYICNAESDAHWDAMIERRAGLHAYCGVPLLWPDAEVFGILELLSREPLQEDEAKRWVAMLENVAHGIDAQLELLFRQEQEYYDSTHDRLTGVANGRLFGEQTRQHLQLGEGSGQLWLLMWSIDELDTLRSALPGSEAETMLRAAVERARGCIRDSDFIARLDDNRFALLVTEANEFVATAVADRIRRSTRRITSPGGEKGSLNISCGITGMTEGDTLKSLMDRCGTALQSAIDYGGGQTITLNQ